MKPLKRLTDILADEKKAEAEAKAAIKQEQIDNNLKKLRAKSDEILPSLIKAGKTLDIDAAKEAYQNALLAIARNSTFKPQKIFSYKDGTRGMQSTEKDTSSAGKSSELEKLKFLKILEHQQVSAFKALESLRELLESKGKPARCTNNIFDTNKWIGQYWTLQKFSPACIIKTLLETEGSHRVEWEGGYDSSTGTYDSHRILYSVPLGIEPDKIPEISNAITLLKKMEKTMEPYRDLEESLKLEYEDLERLNHEAFDAPNLTAEAT